ncbi:MAG: radical SAM family heme chaperone HemW [Chloroflexi bacterium]|nr:radical SAM family heme chaperone HemW [Chloroflexota bacterium]
MQRTPLSSPTKIRHGVEQGIALYIHIPFCMTRCPYCDFNTYAGIGRLVPSYLEALAREIQAWGALLAHPPVATVFLGGGTPSLLSPDQLSSLLEAVSGAFGVQEGAELTLEANPDDVTLGKLQGFARVGVNRLSLGVQSLDPALLRLLGRRHGAEQAAQAVRLAQQAGFANISLDLMYGLPHQSTQQWRATLRQAVAMQPQHLSAYCLTLEEGTPMEASVRQGLLPEPDPDLAADMYLLAQEELGKHGYRHYEISNWAQPGFESRHNLTYWRNLPYLGVGPGAHSSLGGYRFSTLASPFEYVRRLRGWRGEPVSPGVLDEGVLRAVPVVEGVEFIPESLEMGETMMLGLRLDAGVSLEGFHQRFGRSLLQVYGKIVEELVGLGLLEVVAEGGEEARLRLSPRGRLLGNEVFVRFVAEAQHGG